MKARLFKVLAMSCIILLENVNIKSISTIKLYKTMAGKVKCIFSENYLMVNQYCYTQLWVLKWTILGIFSAF